MVAPTPSSDTPDRAVNYVEQAKTILGRKINVEDDLLDLYTLLVLTHGVKTFEWHVHDAWSIWRNKTNPDHKSLIPFDDLDLKIQQMDTEYVYAINETARELNLLAPQPSPTPPQQIIGAPAPPQEK